MSLTVNVKAILLIMAAACVAASLFPASDAISQKSLAKRAANAVEECLAKRMGAPTQCLEAAARFCGDRTALSCETFQKSVWVEVARAAEGRLHALNAAADKEFVSAAAEDLRAAQRLSCERESEGGAEPALERCLRLKSASRAIALWSLAPSP